MDNSALPGPLDRAPQPFSPATLEPIQKRNRTSLPQGTAQERELHKLSKLSDVELAKHDDSIILGESYIMSFVSVGMT